MSCCRWCKQRTWPCLWSGWSKCWAEYRHVLAVQQLCQCMSVEKTAFAASSFWQVLQSMYSPSLQLNSRLESGRLNTLYTTANYCCCDDSESLHVRRLLHMHSCTAHSSDTVFTWRFLCAPAQGSILDLTLPQSSRALVSAVALGYNPPKPWLDCYMQRFKTGLSQLNPEGLVDLLRALAAAGALPSHEWLVNFEKDVGRR